MNTLTVFAIILTVIAIIIFFATIIESANGKLEEKFAVPIAGFSLISTIIGIASIFLISYIDKENNIISKDIPTALDVYRNKTTIQINAIEYPDCFMPIDTVVIFKPESKNVNRLHDSVKNTKCNF